MTVKKLFMRNLMYLYTSVFTAGIRNIAVQIFFDTYYPENKETLVSIALFISSVFTMFGILSSSWLLKSRSPVWSRKRNKFLLIAGMLLTVCISFASMFLVQTFAAYTALFCITAFCVNFMYNVFDVFISGTVSETEKEKNVRILLTYQMLGYIVGPLAFSYFASSPQLCIAVTTVMLAVCYLAVSREYIAFAGTAGIPYKTRLSEETNTAEKSADTLECKADRVVMLYSFMMYCATNTLMPSVAYLMKDYLQVEDYAVKSSLFLAGTVVVSAFVIALLPARKLWKLRTAAPLSIAAALALIIMLRSSAAPLLAAAAGLSGFGNGVFLSGSRYYVNSAAAARGLVGRYNRTMTESTLIGYMIAAVISWLCLRNHIAVVPAKLSAILFLLAAAVFFSAFRILRQHQPQK